MCGLCADGSFLVGCVLGVFSVVVVIIVLSVDGNSRGVPVELLFCRVRILFFLALWTVVVLLMVWGGICWCSVWWGFVLLGIRYGVVFASLVAFLRVEDVCVSGCGYRGCRVYSLCRLVSAF